MNEPLPAQPEGRIGGLGGLSAHRAVPDDHGAWARPGNRQISEKGDHVRRLSDAADADVARR